MSHRIELVEFEGKPNTVEIFDGEAAAPFLRQPNWPNGAAWANAGEARDWAEMFIEALVDADAPYAPNGPGEERQPKPTPEQIAEWEAQRNARLAPPTPPTE